MWRLWLGIDLTLFSSWVFDPHLGVDSFWGSRMLIYTNPQSQHEFMPLDHPSKHLQKSHWHLQNGPLKVEIPTLKHPLSPDFHGSCLWGCGLELPAASPTKLPTSRVWMWNAVALHRSFQVVCPHKTDMNPKNHGFVSYGFPKLESRISGDPPFFSSQGQLYLQEWYFWFQVALPKRNGLVKLRGWVLWNAIGCYSLRCTYFCGKLVVLL